MQILNVQHNSKSPYFKGIHIATSTNRIKNVETKIDLYEITRNDKAFLKKLKETVNMESLFPDKRISKPKYQYWHDMLSISVDQAFINGNKSIIAVKDEKPCGIITFKPDRKTYFLTCICTWPVETGKKVILAGQTLFKQMFSEFLKQKSSFIELFTILNEPFSVVPKYMRLGFQQSGEENFLIPMRTNQKRVKNTMKNLNDIIITTPVNDLKDVNLLDKLKL